MSDLNEVRAVAGRLAAMFGPERAGKIYIGIRVAGTLVEDAVTETDDIVCYLDESYAGTPEIVEVFEGHKITYRPSFVRLPEPEVGLTWTGLMPTIEGTAQEIAP